MKKYFFTLVILLTATIAFAQPGKKPAAKEKPPTQKEMEEMMKEMQKAMNEIDPEDKKAMDSMGIKIPDTKNIKKSISGISDVQLKKAYEDDSRIVPPKDAAGIAEALATTLSNTEVSAYINNTQQWVVGKLSANTKLNGAEILQQVTDQKSSVGNTAVGLWMDGKPTLALYLMGEACKAAPSNAINLNNYASFLTMCGAQQMALPILINLNKRYPKNSSILNNIAQAWLGLGDIPRADKYADSTLRIYAAHPQANMAKCLIEESKGNIAAAIAFAKKSISKAYSNEKENKLKKLGYNLKSDDINWNRPMPQDALGLAKFRWPDYPVAVEQNELLEKEWKNFKEECQQKIDELKIQQQSLEEAWQATNEYRIKLIISESQKGNYVQPMPGYAAKAIKKLGPGVNDVNGNMSFVFAQALEPVVKALAAVAGYENTLSEKQELLDKKYEDQVGEGRPNPFAAICKDENAIRSEFLNNANGGLKSAYRNYLNYVSRRTSDLLYFYQYTLWPDQFELVKVNAQIAWLTQIKDQRVFFKSKSSWCIPAVVKPKGKDSLQNFDDVACQYVSTMDLGCYKIISSCSNLTGEFDCGGIKINVNDNVETGRFSGTAIVGISKGIDGPMGMEAEATLAGLVEWDNTGFTDVGAIVGVAANAGGQNIAGAEVRATVNSGVSRSGNTILQGNK
jgi:Tfp pilus assembly protein PilF